MAALTACSRPAVSHLDTPSQDTSTLAPSEPKLDTGLPFREPELPAGTQVTVQLSAAITAGESVPGTAFTATVAEPVVIEDIVVVPQGSAAAGRIESARPPVKKGSRGSLRLVLDSIDVSGKPLPIRTSSLFTRGNSSGKSGAAKSVTLEQGHRLTFRLAEPVYLASQQGLPAH